MTDSPDQVAEYIWAIAMLLEMHARQASLDSAAHLLAQVVQNASEVLAQHRAATPLWPEIASGGTQKASRPARPSSRDIAGSDGFRAGSCPPGNP